MKIELPELSLVVLIGCSGSGKSTFGKKHFKGSEVVSSDFCRYMVADDENDQSASRPAFELLHYIVGKRLDAGRLTVIDATSVQAEDRKQLIELAKAHNCLPIAIVFNIDEEVCQQRNLQRPDRNFGPHVIRRQNKLLQRSFRGIRKEGFNRTFIFNSPEEVEQAELVRTPLWNNKKTEHGPFDIIGDIHGCFDETILLLEKLGYKLSNDESDPLRYNASHPDGRCVVFVGDLVDRGPKTPDVLRLVMNMVNTGNALCVAGNHDVKLMRKLSGKNVNMTHGLLESWQQLESETDEFKSTACKFLDALISHYVFDDGNLVVAHAGLKEAFQGRSSGRVREFCLYGETTGETDEYGLPVRYNWAADYRGRAIVVYGHTPVPSAAWVNNTICLDTGCVFGGELTALRYPERELVSVPAARMYYEPMRPLAHVESGPHGYRTEDDMLSINDVCGKKIINTRLQKSVTVREQNAAAALEVMSRFAINPRWLVYLPPTMSPCGTSKVPGFLERPEEALDYYVQMGQSRIICEEKHMGSRAIVVVCKDEASAQKRFGVADEGIGVCYTRTGRQFFSDEKLAQQFLTRIRDAANESGFWEEFQTDWMLLDCELMPWSMKAQELIRRQYASTGAAASRSMIDAQSALAKAGSRGVQLADLQDSFRARTAMVEKYVNAYRRYCWNVDSLSDVKLAPFHLLATEGVAHTDKPHIWHLSAIAKLARAEGEEMIISTPFREIDLLSSDSVIEVIRWWEGLTAGGGEGMVVKPYEFVAHGPKGYLQPAVKCRGSEYLRIIYGPEYDDERYLERLRHRGLSTKRSLAMREFSLGVEAVERFVLREPLYRVHECVFAVLAMESEPVDPRL